MATADSADLDTKRRAAFAQTQALDAVIEQTAIPQFQVKVAPRDLCKMRDQPRNLYMLLFNQQLNLTLQIRRREFANLCKISNECRHGSPSRKMRK